MCFRHYVERVSDAMLNVFQTLCLKEPRLSFKRVSNVMPNMFQTPCPGPRNMSKVLFECVLDAVRRCLGSPSNTFETFEQMSLVSCSNTIGLSFELIWLLVRVSLPFL